MTGIDRDTLARAHRVHGFNGTEVACTCNTRRWLNRTEHAAHVIDAVIARLAATGPRDTGLRERIEALRKRWASNEVHGVMADTGMLDRGRAVELLDAALAAPDPTPDQKNGLPEGVTVRSALSWALVGERPYDQAKTILDRLAEGGYRITITKPPARDTEEDR